MRVDRRPRAAPALLRAVVGLACLALLVAACSPRPAPGDGAAAPAAPTPPAAGGPSAPAVGSPTPGQTPTSPGDPPQAPPASGDGAAAGDSPGGQTAPSGPQPPPLPADTGGVGTLCRAYLRPGPGAVVIEVDAQAGAELQAGVVDHAAGVLESVTARAGGVSLAGGSLPGGARTWTTADLRAAAAAAREVYSADERMAMYVLSVRGRFSDPDALGVAYNASEIAVFPDQLDGLQGLLGTTAAVQRAILVHEIGHLLCLVGIGYDSAHPREDPDHPHHSTDTASVMYWAIDTSAVARVFQGPPPDDFTAQDRADLQALASGRA